MERLAVRMRVSAASTANRTAVETLVRLPRACPSRPPRTLSTTLQCGGNYLRCIALQPAICTENRAAQRLSLQPAPHAGHHPVAQIKVFASTGAPAGI